MKSFSLHLVVALVWLTFCSSLAFAQEAKAKEEKSSQGKTLFLEKKCGSCHSIEVVGIKKKPNQKPPDLSAIGSERSADWFTKYLQKKEAIEGRKHLMKFQGSDEELAALTKWLETLKPDTTKAKK